MKNPLNIIFLCTGNPCRSQMAEGWARGFSRPLFEIQSAGIETHWHASQANRKITDHRIENVYPM